ncbi:MAG TPA: hypothetical protein VFV87_08365 [Pirellulaceae bacterium]|nr:hypothetical protein [Pirellulaceae bacterium]
MSIRTELRRRLELGLSYWPTAELDGSRQACPKADLAGIFGAASSEQLGRLRDALGTNRVVRGMFVDRTAPEGNRGCLLNQLLGWTSSEDLWKWDVDDRLVMAASRTMRRWDDGSLTPQIVLAELAAELERREAQVELPAAQAAGANVPTAAALAG